MRGRGGRAGRRVSDRTQHKIKDKAGSGESKRREDRKVRRRKKRRQEGEEGQKGRERGGEK